MQSALMIMQIILTGGNICVIGYAFVKFLGQPHNTLDKRVTELEVKQKEVEQALHQGNDRFRNQNETNEVLIHSTLALIEYEIQYCLTEHKPMSKDLERAKEELHNYLAKK